MGTWSFYSSTLSGLQQWIEVIAEFDVPPALTPSHPWSNGYMYLYVFICIYMYFLAGRLGRPQRLSGDFGRKTVF
jgi:hypothetical protein